MQSLLTGNIAANAQVKLGAFGLDTLVDLSIGAYGSDHRRRGQLVAVALQKYERKHGAKLAPRDVVLVGDTPLDVAAAREGGARAVAVATGPFDASELAAAGADAVLADLRDTDAVVEAVLAELTIRSTRAVVGPINRSDERRAGRKIAGGSDPHAVRAAPRPVPRQRSRQRAPAGRA